VRKDKAPQGPTPQELRSRVELDRLRREVRKLKGNATDAATSKASEDAGAAAGGEELQRQIEELDRTKQRLSKLYFSQVQENRRRAQRLRHLLESLSWLNEEQDLDARLRHIVATVRAHLGFRRAALRLREPGAPVLLRRASAGEGEAPRGPYDGSGVAFGTFEAWCAEGERIGQSTLVGRVDATREPLPDDAPAVQPWDWLPGMRLIVPIRSRHGELVGDLTVDEPDDKFVPPLDSVELLEVLAQHAAVAIENARLVGQLERHAHELEEAGRRTQELQALKSAFLSSLSHELHGALTAIRAYAEGVRSVREGDLSFEQVRGFLLTVHDESRRLARLSESLLDYSRFEPGPVRQGRARFLLEDVIGHTEAMLRPLAESGQVALKLQIAVDDTAMEADRDQVQQLTLHLGRNALRYTPPGGSVTFRLNGDERDLMLEVEDTGVGIPEAQLETIFDRAHTPVRGAAQGANETRLSLAICRSIVEWHGGRIAAESEPGAGSRFTVVMPRMSGPRVLVRAGGHHGVPASEDALRLAIEMVADVMSARAVTLFEPDESGSLVVRACTGVGDVADGAHLAPGNGVAGWVFQNARPACVAHAGRVPEGEPLTGGAYLCVPLDGLQGPAGVLGVSDPIGRSAFDASDAHLLLALAARVGVAWEDTRALERPANHGEDHQRTLNRVLEHLEMANRRAPDRVKLAREIARNLDLGDAEVGRIAYAASLYDLGMSRGDPRVAGVEGLSTQREMEGDAETGAPLDRALGVREMVLNHHEWWDGSGYPRGLAGDRIPIGARILAVVDAWESLIVGRPHRPGLSAEAARAEIHRRRGAQFDPAVVEAFEMVERSTEREPHTAHAKAA